MSIGSRIKNLFKEAAFFKKDNELTGGQKWAVGLMNLLSVVIFWVASSFLVSDIFESEIYRKPFLITYLNTACFSFYLIPYLKYEGMGLNEFIKLVRHEYNARKFQFKGATTDIETNIYGSGSDEGVGEDSDITNEGSGSDHVTELGIRNQQELKMGILETVLLSFQFCALWFTANLVTNASLSYTSVASQTILSSTSSFFTLLVGFLYSIERVTKHKIYGVVLCFSGVLIVTKIDSSSSNPTTSNLLVFFGNMLALSGALVYGVYTILLKVKTIIKNSTLERELNTHLFFAFVGLFCLCLLWPVLLILHFTGIETLIIPKDPHILTLLFINMFITFISDFCWCKAVILTSPLTVTVGLSMTIPLAMVGDWLIKGFSLNWIYITGAAIVTIGFLIINNDEREDFSRNRVD